MMENELHEMRESVYDFLCAVMLGVGNMCLFLGYDTQTTIVEPVMRSVHDRDPERIDMHAGYNGTAACAVFMMIFSLAAPWTLALLGSKGSILLGSVLFTAHLSTFLYVHYIPFYATAAAIGIGYALFHSGSGAYITEHSTKRTIARNSAMSYALATSSLVAGGLLILLTSLPSAGDVNTVNATMTDTVKSYRQYSDSEIRLTYGAFAAMALIANIIFAFMPTRPVENSLAKVNDRSASITLGDKFKAIFSTMLEKQMLLAAPVYLFLGITTTFWISIYPATLIYSKQLAGFHNLQAYYTIALGIGEISMGAVISILSKHISNFAQMPTMIIGLIIYFTAMIIALLSTPFEATHTPTDNSTIFLQPSIPLCLLIGLLLGIADSAFVTSRTVLCSLLIPDKISHVFSISKFHQSFAMSALLFVSSYMSMPLHFALNLSFGVTAIFCYKFAVLISLQNDKKTETLKINEDA